MGEIGIPRREFLYDIQFWEARRIYAGYAKRSSDIWYATRWQTYNIVSAQVGGKQLVKHGIHKPSDLLPLPWDKEELHAEMTQTEREQLQAEMAYINSRNKGGRIT